MKLESPIFDIKTVTRIGVVSALLCAVGPLSIPLPFTPVPISLIQLVLITSVYALGTRNAFISTIIYLFIGALGVPVFSGFGAGIGALAGPTGGYLIGFIFLVLISGYFINKRRGKIFSFLGMVLGNAVCYAFGTLWLSLQMSLTFGQAFLIGVAPYVAFDLIKSLMCLSAGDKIRSLPIFR